MHFYQHNIKSFNNATRHLTRVERSLYRDLIELYYDTEQPLPADDFDRLSRRVLANSDEEKEALKFVLDEFFVLTGAVWTHERCDIEIEKYQESQTAKARAGKASVEARKKKSEERKSRRKKDNEQNSTGVQQVLNECATNQEPITNNQEPRTTEKKTEKIRISDIKKIYNEILGGLLGKIRDISPERKRHLQARINDDDKRLDIEWWVIYFEYVANACPYLVGDTPKQRSGEDHWRASFDWLINPNNMTKVLERKYEPRQQCA